MRIALVADQASPFTQAPDSGPAGQQTRIAALARELARQDHDVTVFARRDAADLPDRAELAGGVPLEHVAAGPADGLDDEQILPHLRAFAAGLADRWRGQQPDVVHAVSWASGLAALGGAREQDIPVVQTFRSLRVAERRYRVGSDGVTWLRPASQRPGGRRSRGGKDAGPRSGSAAASARGRLERAVACSADTVLASSSDEISDLASLGVPRSSVRVVPAGVDTSQFSPDGPVAPRGERPRLLTVATHLERDGLETAVQALADIPDAELLVVGGPERRLLRQDPACCGLARLAGRLGVSNRVLFTGRVSHAGMPALLRSADLMVDVSWYEQFGMPVLEAMACGTPVIASAVGGHTDTVVDGTTGELVPPGGPAHLARRIRRLLTSPMLLEGYGIAAVDRARARYSWDRVGRETVSAYGHAQRSAAALQRSAA